MESRSPKNLCIVHKRIKAFRISNACQSKPLERAGSVQVDHKATAIDVEGLQVEADSGWQMADGLGLDPGQVVCSDEEP